MAKVISEMTINRKKTLDKRRKPRNTVHMGYVCISPERTTGSRYPYLNHHVLGQNKNHRGRSPLKEHVSTDHTAEERDLYYKSDCQKIVKIPNSPVSREGERSRVVSVSV